MGARSQRLDDALIAQGLFATRDEVLRAVIAGEVLVDEARPSSAAIKVTDQSAIRVLSKGQFVSRGGQKLLHGIEAFDVAVAGKRCLDIGSSTGGFTDCLLQCGAREVVCVDVNYGQLSWKLRCDDRVSVHERTNIRTVPPDELGAPFDGLVIDVSFIGLASLAPIFARLSRSGTFLLALIKPQFEAKRGETEGGVVRDAAVRARTIEEVSVALEEVGFHVRGVETSPLQGPAGNIEFLLYAMVE